MSSIPVMDLDVFSPVAQSIPFVINWVYVLNSIGPVWASLIIISSSSKKDHVTGLTL